MKIYIELTNLMNANFLTGIQRVVKENAIRMLEERMDDVVLMTYSGEKGSFVLLNKDFFIEYFKYNRCEKKKVTTNRTLDYTKIPAGSVFFDMDSVWHNRLKRSFLYPALKQRGVKIVTLLHDLIPITHPQFCHKNTTMNFMTYAGAVLLHTDLVIATTEATRKVLDKLTDTLGIERKKSVVIPLGSDFSKHIDDDGIAEEPDPEIVELATGKYILMVGTVEPRKNHKLLVDALDAGLADETDVNIIFAGKIGWNIEEFIERMRNHPLFGKRLFFFEQPNDASIEYLYKNAFAVAFPTFMEGFGLPVIEAFQHNTPVIASNIEVLREIARGFANYFDNSSPEDFIKCVKKLIDNPEEYKKKKDNLKNYVPVTWDSVTAAVLEAIDTLNPAAKVDVTEETLKQMVVLTARNDDLLATLPFIEEFMPFIKEMVICCPDKNVDEIMSVYKGRLTLKFLTDSDVLTGMDLPEDHSTRNFFLRCLILKKDILDDVFIMTDDDYRPLREIKFEDFVKDGKYLSYYCYDLNEWQGRYRDYTSFDYCMQRSRDFLAANNYPTMMYSSHQPQIIDKRIFNDMIRRYPYIITTGVCEWCTYFNYGLHHYPDLFNPVPYTAMCWPGGRDNWDVYVQPKEFVYENHYATLYDENRFFSGFRKDFHEDIRTDNLKKTAMFFESLHKQTEWQAVYNSYCETLRFQNKDVPSITVVTGLDGNTMINVPSFIQFKSDAFPKLPISVDKAVMEKYKNEDVILHYWFSNGRGGNLSGVHKVRIRPEAPKFKLNVPTPAFNQRGVFQLKIVVNDEVIARASIKTNLI